MYQALYRKWRPQNFEDFCGQAEVVQMLRSQMKSGRISHAYLLCGTRGTGKTTIAKILAKAVNCQNLTDGSPCGVCSLCRSVADGSNVDIIEIDAASNNGVDNVRDIRDAVVYTPAMSKFKVYIIDEVHMLSNQAFNALLKTLEEPPAHVIFILATTDPNKLPATILSRCQRFDFKPLSAEILTARLKEVCLGEGFDAEDSALSLIAHLANGGMRDALSLLDQCSAGGQKITYSLVSSLCGMGARGYISMLLEAIDERDFASALKACEKLSREGKNFSLVCEELLSAVRDMLIIKTVEKYDGLVSAPEKEAQELAKIAADFTVPRLLSLADTLLGEKERLARNGGRQLDFELLLFRACSPETKNDFAALEERICALERAAVNPAPVSSPAPKGAEPKKAEPAPAKPTPPPPAKAAASGTPPFWAELLSKVDGSLAGPLRMCKAELENDRLVIYCNDFARGFLALDLPQKTLAHAIKLVSGRDYEVILRDKNKKADDPFSQIDGFKIYD